MENIAKRAAAMFLSMTSHIPAKFRRLLPVPAAAGLVSFALHLDKHLGALIAEHGTSTYAILFAIVFAETGLLGSHSLALSQPRLGSRHIAANLSVLALDASGARLCHHAVCDPPGGTDRRC